MSDQTQTVYTRTSWTGQFPKATYVDAVQNLLEAWTGKRDLSDKEMEYLDDNYSRMIPPHFVSEGIDDQRHIDWK